MFGSALLLVFGEALTQCVMSVGLPQDFIRTKETGISVRAVFFTLQQLITDHISRSRQQHARVLH